jgi:hypothetical protein
VLYRLNTELERHPGVRDIGTGSSSVVEDVFEEFSILLGPSKAALQIKRHNVSRRIGKRTRANEKTTIIS